MECRAGGRTIIFPWKSGEDTTAVPDRIAVEPIPRAYRAGGIESSGANPALLLFVRLATLRAEHEWRESSGGYLISTEALLQLGYASLYL